MDGGKHRLFCTLCLAALLLSAIPSFAIADGLVDEESRFYLAPIVGASWSSLSLSDDGALNRNLFTAGGAAGIAIPREAGQLRLEVESRYRDSSKITASPDAPFEGGFRCSDNWSVLANVWRDFAVTEDFGVYAGAGIGGGGYALNYAASLPELDADFVGNHRIANFAWQAGGGVVYAVSDQITLDLGYRFYNVADSDFRIAVFEGGSPVGSINLPASFAASEMLLTLRIYEPFRGWTL